jgi:hypothetical protein
MIWLRRWNFIERARLERQLWEAFERGEPIEERVQELRAELEASLAAGTPGAQLEELRLRLEIWDATLPRIRRIEAMMTERGSR